ncbi:laccase [Salvia divinorum]|uniref:Laccase n=1 Tax=Salvia divinorum TaxID=28513 RepID=A0ABD1FR44_SALDI
MGFTNCSTRFSDILAAILSLAILVPLSYGKTHHHTFVVKSCSYTRLCSTKQILTVNGKFPGPTLRANRGDKLIVRFRNEAEYNLTLHWHGVRQPRNPWSDGAEYVNQCPIRPGKSFTYNIQLTSEEGTIWWHAHSGWARATLHGIIIVYPKHGVGYPFPKPYAEVPLVLGEWWKTNVMDIEGKAIKTGGEPMLSDAYTINGQPGDFYPCSRQETFKIEVKHGKTYLVRLVNAVMDESLFFSVSHHKLTVVGTDGFYTKPFVTGHIMISPGQSMDLLLTADQPPSFYYLSAAAYSSAFGAGFDNTTTTAILHYRNSPLPPPSPPPLPPPNATSAATQFTRRLRSLSTKTHPINVPTQIDTHLLVAASVNLLNSSGAGPFGRRFAASLNNVSFVPPASVDILQAYYRRIHGVYTADFPENPPKGFDYTGRDLPEDLLMPEFGTRAVVLEYNAGVEMVLQGTNVLASDNHPMHLHGYGFYVVGWGFGNFDSRVGPLGYNLVDPPQVTTVGIPNNGWVAIRFRADNPGVWLMHCHLERHQMWGMSAVIVVKDGADSETKLLPPPHDLPSCTV